LPGFRSRPGTPAPCLPFSLRTRGRGAAERLLFMVAEHGTLLALDLSLLHRVGARGTVHGARV